MARRAWISWSRCGCGWGGALGEGAVSAEGLEAWEQAVVVHGRATRYRPPGELGDERDAFGRWARTARTVAGEARDAAALSSVLALAPPAR